MQLFLISVFNKAPYLKPCDSFVIQFNEHFWVEHKHYFNCYTNVIKLKPDGGKIVVLQFTAFANWQSTWIVVSRKWIFANFCQALVVRRPLVHESVTRSPIAWWSWSPAATTTPPRSTSIRLSSGTPRLTRLVSFKRLFHKH